MDYTQQNKQAIIEYLQAGVHAQCSLLGVEVEHFLLAADESEPLYYEPHAGLPGVCDVLEFLSTTSLFNSRTENGQGQLLGLDGPEASISLEPAAQLEISIAPYERVADVVRVYNAFRAQLDPWLEERGCKVASVGYNPIRKALDMPLIPKARYTFMDEHFKAIGTHGYRMMRGSAATQVSFDYSSEADAVRKARVANAIVPVLGAICDNVAVFEGEPNSKPLARLNLWRDVDNARCRVIPGLYAEGFGFEEYADYLLRTRPIFVSRTREDGTHEEYADDGKSAAELYAAAPMERPDVEHVMSMFWPDVRIKRFVEVRPADCMPAPQVYGYTALLKGLLYSENSLSAIERAIGVKGDKWPISEATIEQAIADIREQGVHANVYGNTLGAWVDMLFLLAAEALDSEERAYLAPLREFATSKPWLV